MKLLLAGLLAAAAGMAQNWQIGGGAGYGVYGNASITGPAGTATAGVRNAYVVTGVATEDMYEHFSGEVRYVYQPGNTFLQSGSSQGSVPAASHTLTYDILTQFRPRESRIRPYLAGGAGAKYYDITGTLPKQPVPASASLTTQSQWEPAFDFGGGVQVRVTDHFVVRGDVRDYISLFPKKLFSPAGGARLSGTLQQFTPMFGIGYRF